MGGEAAGQKREREREWTELTSMFLSWPRDRWWSHSLRLERLRRGTRGTRGTQGLDGCGSSIQKCPSAEYRILELCRKLWPGERTGFIFIWDVEAKV